MKTTIITCALVLGATLLSAQDNSKKETKVRIKKIENINGVEKVTDTTYTTTDASVIDASNGQVQVINVGDGKEANVVIVKSHSGDDKADARVITRTASDVKDIDAEIEKALNEAGIDPNAKGTKKIVVINEDHDSKSGEKRTKKFVFVTANLSDASEGECKKAGIKPAPEKLVIEDMNCMPNPSNGKFNLKFSGPDKSNADITIKDINGKVVYTELVKNFSGSYNKEINIDNNAKGIYFVTITQGTKATTKKLVVE
ncbi:MAG: hypothetical protein K0S32_1665 [Bacteroidetes bacterium]|nr:hypothetical protein [Bacteroidota bacterium]